MSDNLTTPVAAGATLATDDVAGVQYPRVKISFGVDGAAADVNSSSRFPVDVGASLAVTQSGAWNVTNITGTVTLPTGAATEATLAALSGKLPATLGIKTSALSVSFAPASDAVFAVTMGAVPTGGATSALQTSGNASLTSIDTKVTGLATAAAQATAAGSLAAIAASAAAVEPFSTGGTVTKSDSTVLTGVRSLWVGGAGDVTVTTAGGDVLFSAVPAGTLLPVKASKVKATGTTATLISWLG